MPFAAEASRFEKLGNAFMQPERAAAARKLRDKRVRQFVFENVGQFGRHGTQPADRDAQLAIVDGSGPRGGMRHIEKCLLGVEGDQNIVARRVAEIASQVVIVGFERGQNLCPECFGGLLAFVVQDEMAALALGEVGFDILLALGFGQELLHRGIRSKFERALPRGNGLFGVVGGELGVPEHGVGIG